MAKKQTSVRKREREMAKRQRELRKSQKAAEKRERRLRRPDQASSASSAAADGTAGNEIAPRGQS